MPTWSLTTFPPASTYMQTTSKIVGPNQDKKQWFFTSEVSTDPPSAMTSKCHVTRHFLAAKLQHDMEVVEKNRLNLSTSKNEKPSILGCPGIWK